MTKTITKKSPQKTLNKYVRDFVSLFYPNLCLSCGNNLPYNQEVLCLSCQYQLPKTDHHLMAENAFTEKFWGRIPIKAGAAMYYYDKKDKVRNLIKQLKYHNKPFIGIKLGQLYGKTLRASTLFQEIDLIVPVPLHPKKLHQRGYNQSDQFAIGLSENMNIPWDKNILARPIFTETQTQKSKMDRFANVEHAFTVENPQKIEGKHLLLVDDVLTTGATLEACAAKLLKTPGVKISMATMAITNN